MDREFIKGKEIGQEIGQKIGREKMLIKQVCKKLSKGMSVSEIADDLEVGEAEISRISKVAEKFAPEYDQDAIFDELQNEGE